MKDELGMGGRGWDVQVTFFYWAPLRVGGIRTC